jgi:hypothetical protein
MSSNKSFNIGAMDMYQEIDAYGKASEGNTIDIATTLASGTITAIGATKTLKSGDIIYVYPTLVSGDGAVATSGNTLTFNVGHYVDKLYFVDSPVEVTFSSTADIDINAELVTLGLDDLVFADMVGTKLRIQALSKDIGISNIGGNDLTALKLTAGDYANPLIFKVTADVTSIATSVSLAEYFQYGYEKFDTTASLQALAYKCYRFMGQSTGATLKASLTADNYKGSSKIAIQTEYNAGESTLSVDAMEFNMDNLNLIKGLTKKTVARTFFSGASADVTYTYGSLSNSKEFALFGISRKTSGEGLILIEADRVKSPSLTIPLGKTFRVMNESMSLLANNDRVICKVFEI